MPTLDDPERARRMAGRNLESPQERFGFTRNGSTSAPVHWRQGRGRALHRHFHRHYGKEGARKRSPTRPFTTPRPACPTARSSATVWNRPQPRPSATNTGRRRSCSSTRPLQADQRHLGHEAGDLLLKEVGNRLRRCVRTADTVARLAGDEFTVLLPEVTEESDARAVAEKSWRR